MKQLLAEWRKFLKEGNELKVQKKPNGFTLDVYAGGSHVGQYTHTREEERVRNFAEIFPEYRGKGHGTMMLLAAIKAAEDLGIDFEEDSESLTPVMNSLYDELDSSGSIHGWGGVWVISDIGKADLEDWLAED